MLIGRWWVAEGGEVDSTRCDLTNQPPLLPFLIIIVLPRDRDLKHSPLASEGGGG